MLMCQYVHANKILEHQTQKTGSQGQLCHTQFLRSPGAVSVQVWTAVLSCSETARVLWDRGEFVAATAAFQGHQLGTFFHITLLLKCININTDILTKTRKSCQFGCSSLLVISVAKGVGKQPSLEIKLPSWQHWFRFPVVCSALPFLLTSL